MTSRRMLPGGLPSSPVAARGWGDSSFGGRPMPVAWITRFTGSVACSGFDNPERGPASFFARNHLLAGVYKVVAALDLSCFVILRSLVIGIINASKLSARRLFANRSAACCYAP